MPSTPVYSIILPTVGGHVDTWGDLLNNDTFVKFDSYIRDNPAAYTAINASGTNSTGQLRLMNNLNITTNYFTFTHSASGTLDIKNAASSVTALTVTSGGAFYRNQNVTPFNSFGPGAIYVPLSTPDVIGDWITASTTSYTDVDVSDDGVPKGALAVVLELYAAHTTGAYRVLYIRKNGITSGGRWSDGSIVAIILSPTTGGLANQNLVIVPIDANGIFEAKWDAALTSGTTTGTVVGYFI